MELNRDNYCEECWLIVSSENKDNYIEEVSTTLTLPNESRSKTVEKHPAKSSEAELASFEKTNNLSNAESSNNMSPMSKLIKVGKVYISQTNLPTERFVKKNKRFDDDKSYKSYAGMSTKSDKSNYSKYAFNQTSAVSLVSILKSKSEILHGGRPSDSDLCLECLVLEYRDSFDKNLLKNMYSSVKEQHQCRMIPVQKCGRKKCLQLCSNSECPKFKFWKILDSGGSGWKVDFNFGNCIPPLELEGSSCFTTSSGLCSKEQLVDLSEAGLSDRIMDEVRPDIEISEWFCGSQDSTSRYGYKVSLLDSRQLMMCVHGECKTLKPPDASKWQRVTYTFRGYEPGVRYILFHHGGQGEAIRGDEGNTHPGCKMAGASIKAKLTKSFSGDEHSKTRF